jgi:hypothetical protein
MKITLPPDYKAPDNAKPGEPFEVVATLVQAEDGSFDLTQVDGMPVNDDEANETDESETQAMAPKVAGPDASRFKMPWAKEPNPTP